VMPNYLTVDGQAQVPPVSWKEKFAMAAEGSFDPYEFTLSASWRASGKRIIPIRRSGRA
jgi:hypothetical protein